MKNSILQAVGIAIGTLLLSAPLTAAETSAPAKAIRSSAGIPAGAWAPVTLTGKIIMVDPAQHLVIVKSPQGVPFDLILTGSTLIRSEDRNLTPDNRKLTMDKNVSARFRPERSGDVALSIQVLTKK